jgi:hypothetical protein
VKCDASDAAGEREPSGRSSYEEVRGRLGSLEFIIGGGAARKLGFETFGWAYPPGISDVGIGGGFDAGSANLGSTSS